jgi:hypothetical protein
MGPYPLGLCERQIQPPEFAAINDHQIRSPIYAAIYHRQLSSLLERR